MRKEHPSRRARAASVRLVPLLVSLLAASSPHVRPEEDSEAIADELPRIAPLEPAEALASFTLGAGLSIELVASEPLVVDPVDLVFDEEGRWIVSEMRDYPFTSEADNLTTSDEASKQPPGRVRILEDTDGDGRVDRSHVFLDGLAWPTAVAVSAGSVYVASAPSILRARDEDGDLRADTVEEVFVGFGRRNVQALLNGLEWGVDLRLHGNASFNGGTIRSLLVDGTPEISMSGRDFRFLPGGVIEATPSGRGQNGLTIDERGERFVASNSDHARHVVFPEWAVGPTRGAISSFSTSIAVDGGSAPVFRRSHAEPWRIVRTRWRAASADRARYPATELVPIGFFTSATGPLVYSGRACGPELQGAYLVGDVGANLVHRKRLERHGLTFEARRFEEDAASELLTSSDNWFRPVKLVEAPDESIYILDMYRETIEHPYSIPDSIRAHLRLTSGNDRGRIWRVFHADHARPPPPRDALRDTASRLRALDAPGRWLRSTAARLLAEAGDRAIATELRARLDPLRSESPVAGPVAIQALWLLERLGALEDSDLERAFTHPDADLRRHAVRLAARRDLRPGAIGEDPSPLVRTEWILGAAGRVTTEDWIAIARRDAGDAWARLALIEASVGRASRLCAAILSPKSGAATDASSSHAMHALLAELARYAAEESPDRLLDDVLTPLVASVSAAPDSSPPDSSPPDSSPLDSSPPDSSPPDSATRASQGAVLRAVLARVGEGLERIGRSPASLLDTNAETPASSAAAFRKLVERELATLGDASADPGVRLAAVELLPFVADDQVVERCRGLLTVKEPLELQVAALRALARRPSPAATRVVLEAWRQLGPRARAEALETLLSREESTAATLTAIEEGEMLASEIDPVRQRELRKHREPSIRARAGTLFPEASSSSRAEIIARYRSALELAGDVERGAKIFREVCAACHRARGEGHEVGPALETVAGRTTESLLEQILDPNREIAPNAIVYTAVLRDGRVATGLIAEESASALRLLRAEGVGESLRREDILRLDSSGVSLMPANLEETLTPAAIADILAFVQALGRKAE